MFDLSDKVVVVTGGGRGIGRGIARCMANAGASVVVSGRSEAPLNDTAEELRAIGVDTLVVPTDITDPDAVAALVSATIDRFGAVDCWVNNAGSANVADVGPLMDLDERQWDAVVDLNLKWTFFAAQAAARTMVGRGGSIVNISSRSGSQPCPLTGHYGAAKAGVENLTSTMAVEWGHHGIRVNAVAPGLVPTEESLAPGGTMSKPSRVARQVATVPMRRLGLVDDIGAACVFFASDEAAWVTGETMQVQGGSRIPVGYLTYMHHITQQLETEATATANAER
jgi:NAD(P)-dependent dehydrogenase (short-subunit alcohol dehydrogenase family)